MFQHAQLAQPVVEIRRCQECLLERARIDHLAAGGPLGQSLVAGWRRFRQAGRSQPRPSPRAKHSRAPQFVSIGRGGISCGASCGVVRVVEFSALCFRGCDPGPQAAQVRHRHCNQLCLTYTSDTANKNMGLQHKLRIPRAGEALPGRATPVPVPPRHFVNGRSMQPPFPAGSERFLAGMGCFWGAERMFWETPGVITTAVGYAAGLTPNPTYEEVCSGLTGHNEVVLAVFDPTAVSYAELLKVFWEAHDPYPGRTPRQRHRHPVSALAFTSSTTPNANWRWPLASNTNRRS